MAEENQHKKIALEKIENWAKAGHTCFDILDLESKEFSRLLDDILEKKDVIENLAANFGSGFPNLVQAVSMALDNYRNKWTPEQRKERANNLKNMFLAILDSVTRQKATKSLR